MHRRVAGRLALILALALAGLAIPTAVAACDCVSPEDQVRGAGRDPRTVVFTGTPGVETPAGVPVSVSRWFLGAGAAPVVALHVEGVMESSCGTTAPSAGKEHLFVVWRQDDGELLFHLCSVAADLGTDEGRAMLVQAQALGPGTTVGPAPAATGPPAESGFLGVASGVIVPLVMVVVVGLAFLLAVVAVLRRTRVVPHEERD